MYCLQRYQVALFVVLLATGLGGCSSFYQRQQAGAVTETVFDSRLPAGIKEVFDHCHPDGLTFTYSSTSVDFKGNCKVPNDLPSLPGQLVFTAAAAKSPLAMDFPGKLYDMRGSFADFPWPLQNCYASWDSEVYFWAMGFSSLATSWVSRNGAPALKLSFGNVRKQTTPYYKPAYSNTIATANCPSPINQGLVRGKLDSSGINGVGDIRAKDFDLDLYFLFTEKDHALSVSVEAEPKLADISIDVDWNKLPKKAKTEFDKQLADLTDSISDSIGSQLDPLAPLIATPMQGAIPSGHELCSVSVRNGQLVIATDDKCA